jgi:hypothetical protein
MKQDQNRYPNIPIKGSQNTAKVNIVGDTWGDENVMQPDHVRGFSF